MKITTKFNSGDKVWYYIPELNKYAWGKIFSINILVTGDQVDRIFYNIENRFFDKKLRDDRYFQIQQQQQEDYRYERNIIKDERELHASIESLFIAEKRRHNAELDEMIELKKGWS